jgi:hypothetical protein
MMLMAVLVTGLGPGAASAQRAPSLAADTTAVRYQLAALLRTDSPNLIQVVRSELQLHPGATVYTGRLMGAGAHGGDATVVVSATSTGMILPMGCPQNRLVLQTANPPLITDSTLLQYAAVLAMLEGDISYGEISSDWRLILDPADVPPWAQDQAAERGLALMPAQIDEYGRPTVLERRVSVMVLGRNALYLVVASVATTGRFLDSVERVIELASRPVG